MTRYDELTAGTADLVTIHVTADEANDRYRFHATRTGLESDRKAFGPVMRYRVGERVPADSIAAREAASNWLRTLAA